jgi:hypothetical protein
LFHDFLTTIFLNRNSIGSFGHKEIFIAQSISNFAPALSVSAAKKLANGTQIWARFLAEKAPEESFLESGAFKLQIIQTRAREDYSAKHRWHQRGCSWARAGWYAQTRARHVLAIFYEGLLWRDSLASCSEIHTQRRQ